MLSPLLVTCLCFGAQVCASTTISTYSDAGCTDAVQSVGGPDTGICQKNTLGSYTSFQVTSLDSPCAVTFYAGSDSCSSLERWAAPLYQCYTNASITQFSVDCGTAPEASTALPSFTSAPLSSPSSSIPSTFQGSKTSSMSSITTVSGTAGRTSATTGIPIPTGSPVGGGNSGLSAKQTINLEVILPTVLGSISILVAIVIGARHWNTNKQKLNP